MARKISVEIVGDSRSLERAFARSSRAGDKFNRSMTTRFTATARGFTSMARSLPVIGGALGGAAIAGGIGKAIEAASDLNEQMNRSRVTFRQSSREIERWSETTATAIGVAQAEALEASSNFGAMFNTIGLADRQSAAMSRRLVQLGADMASFNNQDPSEMLDRLRSGLAGEAEPLRRFGVLLSEARVKQEAYRSGIAKTGAELTEQQKVQARYNILLRDTRLQQGDFARTSEGMANQLRALRANFGDLIAKLGTALLPIATKLVVRFNTWISQTENQTRLVNDLTKAVEGLGKAIETVERIVGTKGRVDRWLRGHRLGFLTGSGLDLARDVHAFGLGRGGGPARTGIAETAADHRALQRIRAARRRAEQATGVGRAAGLITGAAGGAAARRRGLTVEQRNAFFDAAVARRLDRLQDLSLRKQLAGLRAIAQTIRARLQVTRDATRRLTLEDKLLDILREQRAVQGDIGDQVRATNAALKDRADAIKSAILERLERRQQDVLNKRALRDAQERLRVARLIGGPLGIRAAREGVQDVRFDILRQRLEGAPARLTRGGQFALGNIVTINIHGVTDPNAVAIKVDEILKRRGRRTSNSTRGAAAGSSSGHR